LWHGAGWTFVVWGGLHGLYLGVNHGWRALSARAGLRLEGSRTWRALAWALTFAAVVVAWVFFRAPDLATAVRLLTAMAGEGTAAPAFADTAQALAAAAALLLLARLAPSTQELTGYVGPGAHEPQPQPAAPPAPPRLAWRPSPGWAVATGALLALALLSLSKVSEFLYFQF
jgi:hypothetical protein